MPMQIGLDELMSMLLSRMDGLTVDSENQKSRFNIMFRVLYKKGLFTDTDVLDSVRSEYSILKELGMIKEMPSEDALKSTADAIMLWIGGDTAAIRKSIEDYDRMMREAASKQQKPHIDVAPAAVLDELDRMGGAGGSGRKLIL